MTVQVFPAVTSCHPKFPIRIIEHDEVTITRYGDPVLQRNAERRFPWRTVEIPYEKLSISDRNTIYAFKRARRGPLESFYYIHDRSQAIEDEYIGYGTGAPQTLDIPSLSTVNDSTLIIKANGAPISKSFLSGGGGGSSDRVTVTATLGELLTCHCVGKFRLLVYFDPTFTEEWVSHLRSGMNLTLYEDSNE